MNSTEGLIFRAPEEYEPFIIEPTETKIKSTIDIINDTYTGKVNHDEIKLRYQALFPKMLNVVIANKVDFLDFIGEIVRDGSKIKAWGESAEVFKPIVMNFDSLSVEFLYSYFTNTPAIKHYTIIKFVRDIIKHPISKDYKRLIVEPLVFSATRLVVMLAKEVKVTVPFEDRLMLGLEGLVDAAWRFEPLKGFVFTTYARSWIRQRIFQGIETGLKVPDGVMFKFHKLQPHWKKFKQLYQSASITDFINWLKENNIEPGLSAEDIRLILQISNMVSYENLAQDYENRTADDFVDNDMGLVDNSFSRFEEQIENDEYLEKFVEIAKKILTPKELKCFVMLTFQNRKRKEVQRALRLDKIYKVDLIMQRAIKKLKSVFPDKESLLNLKPSEKVSIVDDIL